MIFHVSNHQSEQQSRTVAISSLRALGAAGQACCSCRTDEIPHAADEMIQRERLRLCMNVRVLFGTISGQKKTSSDIGKIWKHGNIGFIGRIGFKGKKTEALSSCME